MSDRPPTLDYQKTPPTKRTAAILQALVAALAIGVIVSIVAFLVVGAIEALIANASTLAHVGIGGVAIMTLLIVAGLNLAATECFRDPRTRSVGAGVWIGQLLGIGLVLFAVGATRSWW